MKKILITDDVIDIPEDKQIPWDHIVIHHSFTKDGALLDDFTAIKNYHVNVNGWQNIGYHFVIEFDKGQLHVKQGRRLNTQGAHTKEGHMNKRGIGVCVVKNGDSEAYTNAEYNALLSLIETLRLEYPAIVMENVKPHSFFSPYKTCPGHKFDWSAFMVKLERKEQFA